RIPFPPAASPRTFGPSRDVRADPLAIDRVELSGDLSGAKNFMRPDRGSQVRNRLCAGGSRIRTAGPTCDGTAVKHRNRPEVDKAIPGGDHDGNRKIQNRAPCGAAMADIARAWLAGAGIRGRQPGRRHLVLESLSRRAF